MYGFITSNALLDPTDDVVDSFPVKLELTVPSAVTVCVWFPLCVPWISEWLPKIPLHPNEEPFVLAKWNVLWECKPLSDVFTSLPVNIDVTVPTGV